MDIKPTPTLRDLYPRLNEKELLEAEDTLDRYLLLVLRIYERIEEEGGDNLAQLTSIVHALRCAKRD
jgi:hypothetical protein